MDGFKFVNPLLECDIYNVEMTTNVLLRGMKQELGKRLAREDLMTGSVYFRDLNDGPWVGINENELFTPASLLKVPIMIAYFKSREIDPLIAKKRIVYHAIDAMPQNIKDDFVFIEGKEYTLAELVEIMIKYSSNRAAELVVQNIDASTIVKVFHDFDIPNPSAGVTEDYMSVKTYAAFFRILYNASYINSADSEEALKILNESLFKKGLVAGLPSGVLTSHKFGERVYTRDGIEIKQLHDCGIVYAGKRNYILCVMTRGSDFLKLEATIKDVSKIVYNNFVLDNK